MLLVEAPDDVQAAAVAFSTHVKAHGLVALLALPPRTHDRVHPARVAANAAPTMHVRMLIRCLGMMYLAMLWHLHPLTASHLHRRRGPCCHLAALLNQRIAWTVAMYGLSWCQVAPAWWLCLWLLCFPCVGKQLLRLGQAQPAVARP